LNGLDTNVLVRYLAQDEPRQAALASHFIERKCSADSPGYISHIVLCELAWVLESNYHQGREELSAIIERLLLVSQFEIADAEVVWRALADYRRSNADFADHLLGRINQFNGCDSTLTFDKKASRQPGFELLG
jgi:predicted nucleic-acid-binding protein